MSENQNKNRSADQELPPLWRPTWKWHFKVLLGVYIFLGVAYFAISAFLSRLPEPYRLREIPAEITPWLHK